MLGGLLAAGEGIASAVRGSQSQGQSISNAGGSNWNVNTAQSINRAQSSGYSRTYGTEASDRAANAAAVANKYQQDYFNEAMKFNSEEAQKAREWEERMANTIYTRSIQNMKEAGINPILAAGMGLSGASVGSGATASISTPSAFMGQTFADTNSANQSTSQGDSYSHGEGGGSWGSHSESWNNSESGLATGIKQMGDMLGEMLSGVNAAQIVENTENALEENGKKLANWMYENSDTYAEENAKNGIDWLGAKFQSFLSEKGLTSGNWQYLPTDSDTFQAIKHYLDDGWDGLTNAERKEVNKAKSKGLLTQNDVIKYRSN